MKNVQPQVPNKNFRPESSHRKPENKDNLDSRKNEEQDFKGDDTTHNKKEHHTEPKSGKK